jgi:5-dehydro-4-deoxyglucarate dehydratase
MFAGGPLAFPITPFTAALELDVPAFQRHLGKLMEYEPPALFVACGTGELAALDQDEVATLVRAAVEVVGTSVPVIAGAGHGFRVAKGMIEAAARAGAGGFLVLPPYLVSGEQEGLSDYFRALAAVTELPLILYQRDNVRLEPATVARLADVPNIVGLKDGLGDVELMQRIVTVVGSRLAYFNGMPTAETFQAAYVGLKVPHYSSAVFNFVPEVAWAFYRASNSGDGATVDRLLRDFFVPLAQLRGRVKGYAVSLVKAGVSLRWGSQGPVRPPLVDARAADVTELKVIIDKVADLVA